MSTHDDFDIAGTFDPDFYLPAYAPQLTPERSDREAARLAEWLELAPGSRVLDLACGHGRHANRLARMGHRVTGVDITRGFLDAARAEAAAWGVDVAYRHGDYRELADVGAFDAVYNVFTALGYFGDEDDRRVLAAAARALKPGGRFLIDTISRDAVLRKFSESRAQAFGEDGLLAEFSRWDARSGRLHTRWAIHRDGRRRVSTHSVRLYTPQELTRLLAEAGLTVTAHHGDWSGAEPTLDSWRIILVARATEAAHAAPA